MNMKQCPSCGKMFPRLLALSRKDNKTMICDNCGVAEAMQEFVKNLQSKKEEYKNGNDKRTVCE